VCMMLLCCVNAKIIDLTHKLSSRASTWPGLPRFNLTLSNNETHIVSGGNRSNQTYWLQLGSISMSEHSGTHMDAPVHFAKGKWSIDQIPLKNLIVPGVVVDVRDEVMSNDDYLVSAGDLQQWEQQHGRIPDGCVLLIRTGWDALYANTQKYYGTDILLSEWETADTLNSEIHFPGVGPDAAQWLVDERSIVGLGIDTPSVDYGQSKTFRTHVILYSHNIYGLEHMNGLTSLPYTGFTLVVSPMNIEGADGTPIRVYAFTEEDNFLDKKSRNNAASLYYSIILLALPFIAMDL